MVFSDINIEIIVQILMLTLDNPQLYRQAILILISALPIWVDQDIVFAHLFSVRYRTTKLNRLCRKDLPSSLFIKIGNACTGLK